MFFCSYVPALAADRNSSSPLRLPREHKLHKKHNLRPGKRKHTNGRKHQTLPPNASTNGGDASRVGILRQRLTDRRVISVVCESLFGV